MKEFFRIIIAILDRLPSRKESLLNAISDKKKEIHDFQNKTTTWRIIDTIRYNELLDQLHKLEERAKNAGL